MASSKTSASHVEVQINLSLMDREDLVQTHLIAVKAAASTRPSEVTTSVIMLSVRLNTFSLLLILVAANAEMFRVPVKLFLSRYLEKKFIKSE